jgi:hypothetical protein
MKEPPKPTFARKVWEQMKKDLPKHLSWQANKWAGVGSIVISLIFLRFSSWLTRSNDILPPTDFPSHATLYFSKTHLWILFPILSVLFIGFHLFCDWKNLDIFSWTWFGISSLHFILVASALILFFPVFVRAFFNH